MTIQRAIEIAIENGYKHQVFNLETMIKDEMLDPDTINSILLDRDFWIALGSGLKWDGQLWCGKRGCGNDGQHFHSSSKKNWEERWRDFIDHLAEGKSIEQFFESLEEPK